MFSFRSLVDAVSQVRTELTDRFTFSPSPDEPSTPELQMNEANPDMFAGASLLNEYQETWEEIHRTTMSQSESAVTAAEKVASLHTWLSRQDALLTQLTSNLEEIPRLVGILDSCVGVVRETGLNISALLVQLDQLEVDCDKLHTERLKSVHRFHLNSYREERLRELNQRKVLMEKSHQETLKVKALKECMAMTERQSAFGELFAEDLRDYRKTGSLPTREEVGVREGEVREEVQTLDSFVPEGDSDLANFLGSPVEATDQLSRLGISEGPSSSISEGPSLDCRFEEPGGTESLEETQKSEVETIGKEQDDVMGSVEKDEAVLDVGTGEEKEDVSDDVNTGSVLEENINTENTAAIKEDHIVDSLHDQQELTPDEEKEEESSSEQITEIEPSEAP